MKNQPSDAMINICSKFYINASANNNADTKTATKSSEEIAIDEPVLYQVVLLNDDYTPMDFVIQLLMTIFAKDYQSAYDITMHIHHFEKGVAGVYSYEIAAEKMNQANELAMLNEFPLQCIIEQT